MSADTRIKLERINEADVRDLFPLWSDRETVRFTNWTLLENEEQCAQRISRMLHRYRDGSGRVGPFVIRTLKNEFVGLIGVDAPEPPSDEHEVWYLLQRRLWGRGFGCEALEQVMTIIQGLKHVKKAVATAVVENVASWRILERNGFHRDAIIPAGFEKQGVKSDLFLYSRRTKT